MGICDAQKHDAISNIASTQMQEYHDGNEIPTKSLAEPHYANIVKMGWFKSQSRDSTNTIIHTVF